jgi:CheY-like chemotaxis protein
MAQTHVLLVDDDADLVFQLKVQLEAAGYAVKTAESLKEGRELIDSYKPDIAVIDLMMEEMDAGFTLSYQIKKKYPGVPVILLTGVTRETGLEFEADGGRSWVKADLIIAKPVRFEQLKRELDRFLKE